MSEPDFRNFAARGAREVPPRRPPRQHGRLPQPPVVPAARRDHDRRVRRAGGKVGAPSNAGDLPVDRAEPVRNHHRRARAAPAWPAKACGSGWKSRSAPTLLRAARSTTRSPRPSPRTASSASTIISARRRCRTCWRCALPTSCSSRCGTRSTSTTCRSPWPKPSASRTRGGYYDQAGALRDMVQNHMLQLLAPGGDGAAGRASTPTRCATRRSRCCAPSRRFPLEALSETRARPISRRRDRRRAGARLRRGTGRTPNRDTETFVALKGSHRQLALGGRAVLPAHRQAPAQARDRDRGPVQVRCRSSTGT